MSTSATARAVAVARAVASSVGLVADDAVVLHASNKVTLRLLPCDIVARVAPAAHQVAQFEIDLARRLAEAGCPVATLDRRVEPRVYESDGFEVTLWTYYEPAPREVPPGEFADALTRLHEGMRRVEAPTPHFTDRVASARSMVDDRERTPELPDTDRALLANALRDLTGAITERGRAEQLLHGEPHPGNLLPTGSGPRFIDFETCCRGPVEFDLAHAPDKVAEHYPGVDRDMLRDCRNLMLAMVTTWRWDRDDRLPDGRRLGEEWIGRLRAGLS